MRAALLPAGAPGKLGRALDVLSSPLGGGRGEAVRDSVVSAQGRAFDAVSGPPLSSDYGEQKAQEFPGRPLLVAGGALRRSLLEGGPGSLLRVEDSELVVGTSVPWAGPVNAARPFLLDEEQLAEATVPTLGEHLADAIDKATEGLLGADR